MTAKVKVIKNQWEQNHCPFCKGKKLTFGVISCEHYVRELDEDESITGDRDTQVIRVGDSSRLYSRVINSKFWARAKKIQYLQGKYGL